MALCKIEGPFPLYGCGYMPGNMVRFRLTAYDITYPTYNAFFYGVGMGYRPTGNELQIYGPFPTTVNVDLTVPYDEYDEFGQKVNVAIFNIHYSSEIYEFEIPIEKPPSSIDASSLEISECENELPKTFRANIRIGHRPDSWSYTVQNGSGGSVTSDTADVCGRTIVIDGITPTDPSIYPALTVTASNEYGTTEQTAIYNASYTLSMSIGADAHSVAPGGLVTVSYSVSSEDSWDHDYWQGKSPFQFSRNGKAVLVSDTTVSAYDPWERSMTWRVYDTSTFTLTHPVACTQQTESITVNVETTYGAWATIPYSLPDGTEIYKSTIQLRALPGETPVNQSTLVARIYGGNAPQPGQLPWRITENTVEWNIGEWIGDQVYESPDITPVLEEMQARGLTTIYISPCISDGYHQAQSAELHIWAAGVRSHTSSGGMIFGGSGTHRTAIVRSHSSTGGMIFGGSSAKRIAIVRTHGSSGGMVFNGSATHKTGILGVHDSSGGMLFGGFATHRTIIPSDTILFRRTLQNRIGTRTQIG
jgi:hypothetical protein